MTFDEHAATMKREDVAALLASHQQLTATCAALTARNEELMRQLEWLKRQVFEEKSERRFVDPDSRQLALGEWRSPDVPDKEITVAEHRRRQRPAQAEDAADEEPLRFDETVPVEEIRLPHPPVDDDHEIVSEKTTYRLAQKPASYVLLSTSGRS